ncbi:hypothetical protein SAMN06295900_11731 [Trinickia caryophylli]|uniref:Uncharacterized protein n=1 Tax=Trinickia caryophylli TaxID=28094 RepID=A0A1X7GNZ5_TRICW|nr:hypothetical protein SAMN06295900_11731 [Trinickia caryophylli]
MDGRFDVLSMAVCDRGAPMARSPRERHCIWASCAHARAARAGTMQWLRWSSVSVRIRRPRWLAGRGRARNRSARMRFCGRKQPSGLLDRCFHVRKHFMFGIDWPIVSVLSPAFSHPVRAANDLIFPSWSSSIIRKRNRLRASSFFSNGRTGRKANTPASENRTNLNPLAFGDRNRSWSRNCASGRASKARFNQ